MHKLIASVLIVAALAGLSPLPDAMAQQETIYKWVDEEGVVHYTARPPEDVEYEIVGLQTRERGESETSAGETEETTDESEGIPPAQPEMAASEPDPELVAARCKQARSNVENLTQRANVLVRGEDGEQRQITDEERERMLEEARAFIEEWC